MRFRRVASIGAVLALCVVFAGVAQAKTVRPRATSTRARAAHVARASGILYGQTASDSTIAVVSQNFDTPNDEYDSQGADNFTVPKNTTWTIKQVVVPGQYFNGTGPADSENVTIYKNKKNLPGAVVKSFTKVGADNSGLFTIPVKLKLESGKYWVSVQVNMDFDTGGEWGWETSTVKTGPGAVWQNPGDGLGTTCTSFERLPTCLPNNGLDYLFQLKGTSK